MCPSPTLPFYTATFILVEGGRGGGEGVLGSFGLPQLHLDSRETDEVSILFLKTSSPDIVPPTVACRGPLPLTIHPLFVPPLGYKIDGK